MGLHKIDKLYYMHQDFFNFYKYWPVYGLLRPKLVADNRNNKIEK